ncbi:GNAT family N-acetyltransferase [Chitinophaga nivalis]|uniref:GNAT family N-acetyltransferase n=1 Tax=Chitinophaga nivalis TaxID=2991709 RepID=A0ABT3ITW6_9BACT|nr:N-acetyltransferase [Chitinophaga nivalis]MCW3462881.1 GNAT family N-acetyltransferase [Chitinophaga nivalis]MCW3487429.1 GNAT family N-acetyltransferase [Chitinophaga nivalis]
MRDQQSKYHLPNGDELIIRIPDITDAPAFLANFQQLTKETDQLLLTHAESLDLDVKSEREFIASYLDDPDRLLLVAEVNGKIIGSVNFTHTGHTKKAHTGEMGIAIEKPWHNLGIGRRLITILIRWAEAHPYLEIVFLQVYASNEKALQLYRNFGFQECGRLPQGIMLRPGVYTDLITMYRRIRP